MKAVAKKNKATRVKVEKGYGPRHAANAKEGDLTQVSTDTVPAMLTPREAVLNRNAAELAGRDRIEQLNEQGNELAKRGVDLAGGKNDMKSKQKPKGYEGGVAKLPKPTESVGGMGTPQGYTNTNKWGKAYGWNPGVPPQLGGGPDPRGIGPFSEPPGGWKPYGGVGGVPPGGNPTTPYPMAPGGSQNVNQYGVPYGWNPGGASLGGGAGLGHGGGPGLGQPGDWSQKPMPRKTGGLYPPGQGIFRGATGASDVPQIGEPNPEQVYSDQQIQLTAGDISKLIQQEGQKQGLNPNQIAGLAKAFSSFGGGGAGGAADWSSNIGQGTGGYSGGISDIGYPPFVAPNAQFHGDRGGWEGSYDPRYMFQGYQGGTGEVRRTR